MLRLLFVLAVASCYTGEQFAISPNNITTISDVRSHHQQILQNEIANTFSPGLQNIAVVVHDSILAQDRHTNEILAVEGYMVNNEIHISMDAEDMKNTLYHEMAHVMGFMLNEYTQIELIFYFTIINAMENSDYNEQMTDDYNTELFATAYGSTNFVEDVAESFAALYTDRFDNISEAMEIKLLLICDSFETHKFVNDCFDRVDIITA